MLSVSRLRILQQVAVSGSFSAAADSLNYTQSAVSQAVAALEARGRHRAARARARGDPSHGRRRRAGRARRGDPRRASRPPRTRCRAIAEGRGGRLRMASFPTAGATLIPLAVATFREANPGVELSLAEGEPEEIAPRLRAGEFDLALLFEFPGVGRPLGARAAARPSCSRIRCGSSSPPSTVWPSADASASQDLRDEPWIQTSSQQPVRPARGAVLPGRGLRAGRLVRERRLPDGPGPGRRGRGRRAHPAACAQHRPLRHRGSLARAGRPDRGPSWPRPRRAPLRPRPRPCWTCSRARPGPTSTRRARHTQARAEPKPSSRVERAPCRQAPGLAKDGTSDG